MAEEIIYRLWIFFSWHFIQDVYFTLRLCMISNSNVSNKRGQTQAMTISVLSHNFPFQHQVSTRTKSRWPKKAQESQAQKIYPTHRIPTLQASARPMYCNTCKVSSLDICVILLYHVLHLLYCMSNMHRSWTSEFENCNCYNRAICTIMFLYLTRNVAHNN